MPGENAAGKGAERAGWGPLEGLLRGFLGVGTVLSLPSDLMTMAHLLSRATKPPLAITPQVSPAET